MDEHQNVDSMELFKGELIGAGTYASVYAHSSGIAIKLIKHDELPTMINELAILTACDHGNIVKLYHATIGDDDTKFHLDRYDCDLYTYGIKHGRMSVEYLLITAHDLFAGLEYLHCRGFVHCDVRAKNVLVRTAPFSAALCDFGISCLAAERFKNSNVYTVTYRPPEIDFHSQYIQYGSSSDMWAAGITLLETIQNKPKYGKLIALSICNDSSIYACDLFGIKYDTNSSRASRLEILKTVQPNQIQNTITDVVNKIGGEYAANLLKSNFIDVLTRCLQPQSVKRISAGDARLAMCALTGKIHTHLDIDPAYSITDISSDEAQCLVNIPFCILKHCTSEVRWLAEKLYTESDVKTEITKYAALYIAFSMFVVGGRALDKIYSEYTHSTIHGAVYDMIRARNYKIF
jgi:serine/threonine protein kinase